MQRCDSLMLIVADPNSIQVWECRKVKYCWEQNLIWPYNSLAIGVLTGQSSGRAAEPGNLDGHLKRNSRIKTIKITFFPFLIIQTFPLCSINVPSDPKWRCIFDKFPLNLHWTPACEEMSLPGTDVDRPPPACLRTAVRQHQECNYVRKK